MNNNHFIRSSKIKRIQIDPFGYCNAKCWFCPVKYYEQPHETRVHMPLDLIEKIFSDLCEEREAIGGVVDRTFDTFSTAHYNEVLLYKNFEGLLELARKYELKTSVLSNGIALSKQNIDLIKQYKDVVHYIGLNIPAFERNVWAKRSGFTPDHFDRLMSNLEYAHSGSGDITDITNIHVNGVADYINTRGSGIQKGKDFDDSMDLDIITGEHETQLRLVNKLFPRFKSIRSSLCDRVGMMSHVFSNQGWLEEKMAGKKVVGCSNMGDRISEWIHVNSLGEAFICCNDYNFDYKYGDFRTQTVREIWGSDLHISTVEKALDGICRKCISAKFS